MAYDTKTLEILHGLSQEGQIEYQKMLERKADEILFKHQHPFKWTAMKIAEMLKW